MKIPEDDPDRIDTKYVEQGQSQSTQTDDESSGLIKKYEQTEIEDMAFMESEFIVTGQEEQTNLNMIVEEIDAEIEYEEISLVPRPTFIVECEFCNKKFDGDDQLDLHLKQHNELQPHLLASIEFFRCSRCLVVFSTMDSWMEHFGSVKLCEMSDELERIDYQYLDDVDNNDPPIRLFSCYKNDKNFLYTCDMCHGNFEQLADFKTHFNDFHLANVEENIGHSLAETPHQCGLCGKEERNLKTILHHIYFHQIDFDCPIENCKQKLSTFTDLYKHIVDEHAERDSFQCRNCLYLAKNREDLREHKQKSCAARTFECGDCGSYFFLLLFLGPDMASIMTSDSNTINFVILPGKTFLRKTTLTTHQRTHTNERRYACQFCDKSFLQSIDLNNHTRTHTQERPFSCGLCGKAFKTLSQRNDHVETHNTENKYEVGTEQFQLKTPSELEIISFILSLFHSSAEFAEKLSNRNAFYMDTKNCTMNLNSSARFVRKNSVDDITSRYIGPGDITTKIERY